MNVCVLDGSPMQWLATVVLQRGEKEKEKKKEESCLLKPEVCAGLYKYQHQCQI